jgi:hypothetical protein
LSHQTRRFPSYGRQLNSTAVQPRRGAEEQAGVLALLGLEADAVPHGVALQVAFERQILKPVFHLIGYRLWV